MKLEDLPKKNIYQVPDRYFDQLPGVVMNRVRKQEGNPTAIFSFWRQPLLRGALAGLALLLTCILIYTFNAQQSNPGAANEQFLSSVSEKDAVEYLMRSQQLEAQDLTILSLGNEDHTHEFIQASEEELVRAVEQEDLDEIYYY